MFYYSYHENKLMTNSKPYATARITGIWTIYIMRAFLPRKPKNGIRFVKLHSG
jgi:hypothetical protein